MSWNREDLNDPKWQRTRLEIMQRDNWSCKKCGGKTKTLNVHHIRYIEGRKPWEYCSADLETICEECHSTLHKVQNMYFSASLKNKLSMWHKLLGGIEKIKRIIEHKVFIILDLAESDKYCIILHAPSFKYVTCPLPADSVYEKMINEPESLDELKTIIMEGPSANCMGPFA
jgi:hypothetical protein